MNETKRVQARSAETPYRVRLPGFITHEEVGLGDVVKRMTLTFGVTPCTGCERRRAALNRRLVFTGGRSK